MSTPRPAALTGIRVLEIANFFAGPQCGLLLADLGADVIKLERPPMGDPVRNRDNDSGYSPTFFAKNRNKRSLMLDITQESGRQVLRRLLTTVDVVIISLRPDSRERLGLAYDAVAAVNPKIIYCSLSGDGETPLTTGRPAFDTTAQARSGLLSLVTDDFDRPMPVKALLSDLMTGFYSCYAILGALMYREATGEGQEVRTSLLESSIAFADYAFFHLFVAKAAGVERTRLSLRTAGFLLSAGDGQAFAVHIPPSPERVWLRFIEAIGLGHLAHDPRFATKMGREENYVALHRIISEHAKSRPRQEWLAILESCDVACAPIHHLSEVFEDDIVRDLGMLHELVDPAGHTTQVVGSAVRLGRSPIVTPVRAPLAGEHSRETLIELGYSDREIEELVRLGVVVTPSMIQASPPSVTPR